MQPTAQARQRAYLLECYWEQVLRRRQVVRLPVSHLVEINDNRRGRRLPPVEKIGLNEAVRTVKLAGNCAEVFKSNLVVTYFICKLHMQN